MTNIWLLIGQGAITLALCFACIKIGMYKNENKRLQDREKVSKVVNQVRNGVRDSRILRRMRARYRR